FGPLFEIDFVAAAPEGRGRSVFQAGDRASLLLVNIEQFLVEDAEDAIEAAVDFLDAIVFTRFLDDAGKARVDDGCGSAGLGDQKITNQFCHSKKCLMPEPATQTWEAT